MGDSSGETGPRDPWSGAQRAFMTHCAGDLVLFLLLPDEVVQELPGRNRGGRQTAVEAAGGLECWWREALTQLMGQEAVRLGDARAAASRTLVTAASI